MHDEWSCAAGVALPKTADVVIIGGGIVGTAAAYFLARAGVSVALCEKGRIAGEQSGRNWGWVRQQGRSPIELPLMIRSLALWRGLQEATGEDLGFAQGGSFYLATDDAALERFRPWLTIAGQHGLDTRLIDSRELGEFLQGSQGRWAGALYTASDGRAEPNRAAPTLARSAARAGAVILTHCAVRGIECAAGRVASVVTEHGSIGTSTVLCAGGAWTSFFCRSLDIELPQLLVKGTVARTAPAAQILGGEAWSPDIAIRRRSDGGYTVARGSALEHALVPASLRYLPKFLPALRQEQGAVRLRIDHQFWRALSTPRRWALDRESPFERDRVLDPAPDAGDLKAIADALARHFPEIAGAAFVETWAGMIESSPDVLPIISPAGAIDGFFVATGFSGHGFGIGPGAGELAAAMVRKRASSDELARFRLSRFCDGLPIRPGPTI
ncbi:MAG: NAD(P)/FAD-dependent oxidoreductase [Steroidobacterales bacterium]